MGTAGRPAAAGVLLFHHGSKDSAPAGTRGRGLASGSSGNPGPVSSLQCAWGQQGQERRDVQRGWLLPQVFQLAWSCPSPGKGLCETKALGRNRN